MAVPGVFADGIAFVQDPIILSTTTVVISAATAVIRRRGRERILIALAGVIVPMRTGLAADLVIADAAICTAIRTHTRIAAAVLGENCVVGKFSANTIARPGRSETRYVDARTVRIIRTLA